MKLEQTNNIFDHKIIDGSEYQWDCYPNARYLDYESEFAHGSVLFSTMDQTIYCAEVQSKESNFQYRWLNPDFVEAYRNEAKQKNVDPDQAWDDVKWTDLEVEEDFLDKAKAVFNGLEFDTRIIVPLTMSDNELLKMMKMAHERDMTLNQFVEHILTEMIEERKRNECL